MARKDAIHNAEMAGRRITRLARGSNVTQILILVLDVRASILIVRSTAELLISSNE